MENDVDVGRDQSYLKCIFIFHEIYDIRGQILYKNTLYRNFIDSNYIVHGCITLRMWNPNYIILQNHVTLQILIVKLF